MSRSFRLALIIALLPVAACATREVLVPKSAVVPAGADLGGRWTIADTSRATNRRLTEAEITAAGGRGPLFEEKSETNSRRDRDWLVHVFLETGEDLKITQTRYGLFISFDRAIVEEYRYGENRRINVGPIVADRVSGWEDGGYVIETLDMEGNKLVERYRMPDGDTLLRQITILDSGEIDLSVVQRFKRADD